MRKEGTSGLEPQSNQEGRELPSGYGYLGIVDAAGKPETESRITSSIVYGGTAQKDAVVKGEVKGIAGIVKTVDGDIELILCRGEKETKEASSTSPQEIGDIADFDRKFRRELKIVKDLLSKEIIQRYVTESTPMAEALQVLSRHGDIALWVEKNFQGPEKVTVRTLTGDIAVYVNDPTTKVEVINEYNNRNNEPEITGAEPAEPANIISIFTYRGDIIINYPPNETKQPPS